MAKEILVKTGTPIVWADATDYSAATSGYTRTHQLDLTSLAASTKARQGAKADLGEKRARLWMVRIGIEFDVAPVAGTAVALYWAASHSATAGTGNDGGASGADEAYKDGEEAEWVTQLQYVGALSATADASPVVQIQTLGLFIPPSRYGMPVVRNTTGQALEGDAVEMFVALIPLIDEVQ
jgi:hypothetical protein